jgi:hypothetical protein
MRKGTIGDLIERARRGEKIGLRRDEVLLQAHLESIVDSAKEGIRPSSEDDIDLLVALLPCATVPKTKGRPPSKSQRARKLDADMKKEARGLQKIHKDWETTVGEMKAQPRFKTALEGKSVKTLRDRWSRR